MGEQREEKKRKRRILTARLLKWCAVVVVLLGCAWLSIWLLQRALRAPARKRAMQSWLDENLNADVSLLGEMAVRINLVRRSRLLFDNTEIEHPNPIFPGKFARIGRMEARALPWSVAGLAPGHLDLYFNNARFLIAENESGEWSHLGLMKPLAVSNTPFPFPFPKVGDWRAELKASSFILARRGHELNIDLNGYIDGRPGRDVIGFHADDMGFSYGPLDPAQRQHGSAGPVNLQLRLGDERGELPLPVAGRCAAKVSSLPMSVLPFIIDGLPLGDAPGAFHGMIRYNELADAEGALQLDGELVDVPLTVFGLPRNNSLRVTWPVGPKRDDMQAQVHLGPAGFGAFTLNIGLGADGMPRSLNMRGDAAALDDIPLYFTKLSQWPDWLSRTFRVIEWNTGSWRGFGWSGRNLQLVLTRSTAGLNLTGEGEMLGGRVRLAMSPDQPDGPITIAAERLNAEQLSTRLSQLMPEPFRTRITGSHVNLTWRGFPDSEGAINEWGTGMVWAKPVIDVRASGAWWRCISELSRAVAAALPEWGGGDPSGLFALADVDAISLDQLSSVAERNEDGGMTVEFRAYGGAFGQATGIFERRRNGAVAGEFLLAGPSRLLQEVERANQELALALDLLANDSLGLRISFAMEPDEPLEFHFPFLDDARRVHEEMLRSGMVRP